MSLSPPPQVGFRSPLLRLEFPEIAPGKLSFEESYPPSPRVSPPQVTLMRGEVFPSSPPRSEEEVTRSEGDVTRSEKEVISWVAEIFDRQCKVKTPPPCERVSPPLSRRRCEEGAVREYPIRIQVRNSSSPALALSPPPVAVPSEYRRYVLRVRRPVTERVMPQKNESCPS